MKQQHQRAFDDTELLERLQRNDEFAFSLLYEKYWPILTRLAATIVEDADTGKEIVQELFIGLYRKRAQLRIKISLSAYLYVALRNRIRNHLRHIRMYNRHMRAVNKTSGETSNDVEHFVDHQELQREIVACLDEMPRKYREVYLLYDQGKFPLRQIALQLSRPVDTVEKQLRRALHLLREHLSFLYRNGGTVPAKVSMQGKLSYEKTCLRLAGNSPDTDDRLLRTKSPGDVGS